MNKQIKPFIIILVPLCLFFTIFAFAVPSINSRISSQFENLKTRIKYAVNPPADALFIPEGGTELQPPTPTAPVDAPVDPTKTPSPTLTLPPDLPTLTPEPSLTPTITPTPLPDFIQLSGITFVDQHGAWNYCAPANLTMALKYWGWSGNRDDVARVVKPGIQDPSQSFIQNGFFDKNVMPYELANFVTYETDYDLVVRHGGDLEVIKRLIAGGFPVVTEKGYYEVDYTGKYGWLGHYMFTTGYDETAGEFIVQDTWVQPGYNKREDYETYLEGWRSFNYLFMVVYPPERADEVFALLGPWGDEEWSNNHALEIAVQETQVLSGNDLFFAWFNKGTSQVQLRQYVDAAFAYDQAFSIYAELDDETTDRPYRLMWYQTGPYWAYFWSGRYQDVINLANTTLLEWISDPTLEESIYWRGKAYLAQGRRDEAIADFRETIRLNYNFAPGWYELEQLGVSP
jgi:hypothetical protein